MLNILTRLRRLLFPGHTGEVQSWWTYTRALKASGWRPSPELELRRLVARRRAMAARDERKSNAGRSAGGGEGAGEVWR